ncbi:hypothetical protein CSB85_4851 [Pseudomonas aeruginosa]|nr:hypothetical protein CSB97_4522 [Pseudomonas aeruginosa]AVK26334.1 hypothetical protein CSB85_4851 [Pseudomonas aeruginosa]AWE78060.1 hypothetical protein CSC31_5734 [Pseudomonas aeruginosa]PRW00253.1 hypothetical protein CSB88_1103 [Pseudomonas aeruginosa]
MVFAAHHGAAHGRSPAVAAGPAGPAFTRPCRVRVPVLRA